MDNRESKLGRLNSTSLKSYSKEYLVYYHLYKALNASINKYATGNLLDIGCGNKPYSHWINKKVENYIGCDIVQSSENKVDIICEATSIPLENDTHDTIVSTQTIEHVGDFQTLVNESFRILKSGGFFIVSGPMYWPLHEEPHDFHRFTKHGFAFALEKAGYEVIEIIPNGGKWALLGQVIMQTLPDWLTFPKILKTFHNYFFNFLDKKFFDPINTLNYVVVGRKN